MKIYYLFIRYTICVYEYSYTFIKGREKEKCRGRDREKSGVYNPVL